MGQLGTFSQCPLGLGKLLVRALRFHWEKVPSRKLGETNIPVFPPGLLSHWDYGQ